MRSKPWTRCGLVVLAALLLAGPATADLIINELEYDEPGSDTTEFLELYNPGDTAVSLDGWTIEFFNGNADGKLYQTVTLPTDDSVPPHGYYVVGSELVPNVNFIAWETNGIQNGGTQGDGIVLLNNAEVVEAFSYHATEPGYTGFTAVNGQAHGTFLPLLGDVRDRIDNSLQRIPDGGVWTETLNNTPGAPNYMGSAPTGACCLKDASCAPDLTQAECAQQGGLWRGEGVPCMDIVAFEACLAGPVAPVAGGCETWDLNGSGHVDLADFAYFQRYNCPDRSPRGACCLWPDEVCIYTTQKDCSSNGGVYGSPEVPCDPNPCTCVAIADVTTTSPEKKPVCIIDAVINNDYDMIHSTNSKNFHIQDPTGIAGLTVYGPNDHIDPLLAVASAGDRIKITGVLEEYFHELEIGRPFTISWLGSPGVPTPFPVSIADLVPGYPTNAKYLSTLIVLQNVIFEDAGGIFAYGNYDIADANDPAKKLTCRISNGELGALPIVGTTIPSGPVDIVGVCGIFSDAYQVMPRTPGDITPH